MYGRGSLLTLGRNMNTESIIRDARAKVVWGEPRQEVFAFLQSSGFGDKEASDILDTIFRERAADIRKSGITKIIIGIFWIMVLIGYLVVSAIIGIIELKLLVLAGISALVGSWKIIEGIGYIIRPSSETGDLSNLQE
jgi:hypothetical protein